MDRTSGELNLCPKCIGSKSFSEWIVRNGRGGPCDFDASHGIPPRVVTVEEFAQEVDRYFRDTYQLGEEYPYFTGDSDSPSYEQYGDTYEYILAEDLDCDEKIVKAIDENLPDYSHREIQKGAEPFYDREANYEPIEIAQRRQSEEAEDHERTYGGLNRSAPSTDNIFNTPPDPTDTVAFQAWLSAMPKEWASVIAVRTALRQLGVLGAHPGDFSMLSLFRAISAARYACLYPHRTKPARDAVESLQTRRRDTQIDIAIFQAVSAVDTDDAARRAATLVERSGARFDRTLIASVLRDAFDLRNGNRPQQLARAPLWRPSEEGGTPPRVRQAWRQLANVLRGIGNHWKVWVEWYGYVLDGSPPAHERSEAWETTFVGVQEPLPWQDGPTSVNAEIARRLEALRKLTGDAAVVDPKPIEGVEIVELSGRPSDYLTEIGDTWLRFDFRDLEKDDQRDAINALKRTIDNAKFTAVGETTATADFLFVHVDPAVVPPAELVDQIDRLVDMRELAESGAPTPPDAPLPPPGPAARFAYVKGLFDIAPTGAWRDREAQANVYHARAKALATGLVERLSRTDAIPDVASSVLALVDVLGTGIADVQPDLLRLASRSIAAKARAYGHPAAQWEISADSVSAFFDLADVLVDLQSFVLTELEAHEQAVRELDLTPEKAADAKVALDLITDVILSAPEVVSERAQTAFEAAAEVSDTATDRDVKVAVEGDRTLLTTNLALAVARELGRDGVTQDQKAAESAAPEDKPAKRQKRTRRAKADADERSWQDFTDRILKRIHQKGPDRIADAALDALTGVIKHAPKTVAGLAAALALWAFSSPIAAGGALASTIAWICYELRRKNK